MSGEGSGQTNGEGRRIPRTGLESWHCIWDASVGLLLGFKGWVGSKGRKGRGGYFSASRSAGLEPKEAGRGESRDWWEEKVYEKPFLVHVCGVYAQMCI